MLAVGRALVLNPRVLLLDEPLEGLAGRQVYLGASETLRKDRALLYGWLGVVAH
jgi:ABC-type molybdenum transport system ATPase subunit/photorepair protein PhrA